jgi:hypothetical protein
MPGEATSLMPPPLASLLYDLFVKNWAKADRGQLSRSRCPTLLLPFALALWSPRMPKGQRLTDRVETKAGQRDAFACVLIFILCLPMALLKRAHFLKAALLALSLSLSKLGRLKQEKWEARAK